MYRRHPRSLSRGGCRRRGRPSPAAKRKPQVKRPWSVEEEMEETPILHQRAISDEAPVLHQRAMSEEEEAQDCNKEVTLREKVVVRGGVGGGRTKIE